MIAFSKKLLFFMFLIVLPSIIIARKTKKLQLIVNPFDPSYFFALNAGNGIETNPGTPRPQGSYYVTNAFIFPGGTVDKDQASYLVDKHGNPIDFENDSLGMTFLIQTMLQSVDFGTPPAEGTITEASQWQLQVNHDCDKTRYALFGTGYTTFHVFTLWEGKAAITFSATVVGGLGCNEDAHNNNFTGKVYIGENGQSSLIKIKFEKEIKYKD